MNEIIDLTLDKWLKPIEDDFNDITDIEYEDDKPLRTHIFIDIPAIFDYFQTVQMVPVYEKLLVYLKEQYGDGSIITLYDGKYNKSTVSPSDYAIQKAYFASLQNLGYNIRNSLKYLKNGQNAVIKGIEVTLAIDLLYQGHNSVDLYDLAVIVCGDHRKYRKVMEFAQDKLKKKIKTLSFLQVYEDDHDNFLQLVDQLGTKTNPSNSFDKIKVNRLPNKIIKEIELLNPTSIRQRAKSISRNSNINNGKNSSNKNKLDTYVFIDYGNIHHPLFQLRQNRSYLKNFNELDFLLSLKNKVTARNNVKKIKLFMGMPRITIKDLDKMRSKKEKLISQLKKNNFEVFFTINENKFTGGMKEQGVDLRIAINIIHAALEDKFEKLILVSGDADFINVIKKLRQLNKEVEVWSFTNAIDNCPLSPFLYQELMKDNKDQNRRSVKSLNALYRC